MKGNGLHTLLAFDFVLLKLKAKNRRPVVFVRIEVMPCLVSILRFYSFVQIEVLPRLGSMRGNAEVVLTPWCTSEYIHCSNLLQV